MITYKIAEPIVYELSKIGLIVTGSFKRMALIIHDLDFLTLRPLDEQLLSEIPYDKILAYGKKYVSLLMNNVQIDIWHVANKHELIFMQFSRDYDKTFQIASRRRARSKGLLLTNTGLYDRETKKPIPDITNIKDIFSILGIKYRTPQQGHYTKFLHE